MKTYNSNYLGICINNNDPEYRGRVQVFVPHIMPALYEKWNMDGKDIQINAIGENLEGSLAPEILEKLIKILPWAEAASPIICPSAPGQVVTTPDRRKVYDQTPVKAGEATGYNKSTPPSEESTPSSGNYTPIQSEKDLLQKAKGLAGGGDLGEKVKNNFDALLKGNLCGSRGACARGAVAIAGAMTDAPDLKKGLAGADADQFSLGRTADNNNNIFATARDNSGRPLYKKIPFKSFTGGYTPVKGDVIFGGGHAQTFIGTQNVREGNNSVVKNIYISDFRQDDILGQTQRDNGAVVYRLTPAGLAQAAKTSPGLFEEFQTQVSQQLQALELTNASGEEPAAVAPVQSTKESTVKATADTEASAANTNGTESGNPNANRLTPSQEKEALNALQTQPTFNIKGAPARLYGGPENNRGHHIDLNGSKRTSAEGFAKNSETSFSFKGGGFANGGTDIFIVVADPKQKGMPFVIRNNNTKQLSIAYGLDVGSKTRPFQDASSSDPRFRGHGYAEMSNAASVAAGLGTYTVVPNIGAVTAFSNQDYTIAQIPTSNIFPKIESGKITREEYNNLINQKGQLTPEQLESLQKQEGGASPDNNILNPEEGKVPTKLVQTPDPGGAHPITNTNNLAKGMFSYPAVGAMLWVFFREGNPLYPVYFAASYSAAEWKSAYNNKNGPAPGNPGEEGNPPGVATARTLLHTGTGGFTSDLHIDHGDITNNSNKFSVFGPNGELTFTDAGAYFFHRRNLREHVEGDKHEVILGNHEKYVQGTSNNVYLGEHIEIYGLFTQETMAAAMELQSLLEDQVYGPVFGTGAKTTGTNSGSQNTKK